jgi:hypothetical protein
MMLTYGVPEGVPTILRLVGTLGKPAVGENEKGDDRRGFLMAGPTVSLRSLIDL